MERTAKAAAGDLPGPVDGSASQGVNPIRQTVGLSGVGIAPSENNGLNATIQLRKRYLKSHLYDHPETKTQP